MSLDIRKRTVASRSPASESSRALAVDVSGFRRDSGRLRMHRSPPRRLLPSHGQIFLHATPAFLQITGIDSGIGVAFGNSVLFQAGSAIPVNAVAPETCRDQSSAFIGVCTNSRAEPKDVSLKRLASPKLLPHNHALPLGNLAWPHFGAVRCGSDLPLSNGFVLLVTI